MASMNVQAQPAAGVRPKVKEYTVKKKKQDESPHHDLTMEQLHSQGSNQQHALSEMSLTSNRDIGDVRSEESLTA